MKSRRLIISCSVMLLVFFGGFFSWAKAEYAIPMPEASHPSGYYHDSFPLTLSAPQQGTIYYTTDGSMPTAASARYDGEILIQNRSAEPNIYNAIPNVVFNWKNAVPDSTPVTKGTVIRAVYVNSLGECSDVLTLSYFVGVTPPEDGYTLSIIFEYDDLFGPNGIYVTGEEYDRWYLSDHADTPAPVPNFKKDLEVPVLVQILDSSGKCTNQPAGLLLQGASSRGMYKKRFRIVAKTEYSGNNVFSVPLYEGTSTHSVMLKSNIPDTLVSDLFSDRAVATQQSIPVQVYLNGEYWYDTFMLERYDNTYFRQKYQIEQVDLVKHSIVDETTAAMAEGSSYEEFMYWVAHTDFSDPEQYAQLKKEVDLQSYIDFIAINYLLCNWDFSDNKNCLMWRSTTIDNTAYADGRWRWCIYDIDAMEASYRKFDIHPAEINIFSCELPYIPVKVEDTALFHTLQENDELRQQFVTSFMDILNNNLSLSKVEPVLQKYHLTLDWSDGFFRLRPEYAITHLAEEFTLSGTAEPVSIVCSQADMGTVVVNTSVIDLSSGVWSGRYFTDFPITIRAEAKDGYEFLGWKGEISTNEESVTLPVTGGMTLEAVFAKAE